MASSSTYAFFHCHYAFQKFPFFCVIWCGGGRHLQNVIFKHWQFGLLSLKRQVVMVQFLSINFFLGFLQFLLGFSKVPVFFWCHSVYSGTWFCQRFTNFRTIQKNRRVLKKVSASFMLFASCTGMYARNHVMQRFPTWGTQPPEERTRTFRGTRKKMNNGGKKPHTSRV